MATITGQHVVNRAFGLSSANDPEVTATSQELLVVLRATLRWLFTRATRMNPLFSGTYADITPGSGKWDRPDGALRVFLVEGLGTAGGNVAAGVEVHNVTIPDGKKAFDAPRIYRLGNCYYSVAEAGDPNNQIDVLRFYFSEDSPGIAGLEACLPEWFQDEWEELVVYLCSRFLSIKDKAREDFVLVDGVVTAMLEEFDAYCLEADLNVQGRFTKHMGSGLSPQGRGT